MILTDATPAERAHVLAHTHPLWGDGLEPPAYEAYIATLMESEWAREGRYRFLVGRERDGAPIATAVKLYRFTAALDAEPIEAGGVGAVFTLEGHRRRGLAAGMLRQLHELMRARGDAIAILFSEIGARYYAGLGYRELPGRETAIGIPPAPAGREGAGVSAGVAVRRFHRSDLDGIVRLRAANRGSEAFDLTRAASAWRYLLARASFPTLHLGREAHESRLMLAQGATAAGYLWGEFQARPDGPSARLLDLVCDGPEAAGALLDDFFAECRRRGAVEARAWVSEPERALDTRLAPPGALPSTPHAVPMWLPLDAAREARCAAALPRWRYQGVEVF